MEKEFIQYEHYGSMNWVRKDLKGKHRDNCLCYSCEKFKPNPEGANENCVMANIFYNLCVAFDVVLPVWECKEFVLKKENKNVS